MEAKHLAILWGTRVATRDGRSGRLQEAILAPRSDRISHLVVKLGFRGTETVPLERATLTGDGTLSLEIKSTKDARATGPRQGSVRFSKKTVVQWEAGTSPSLQGFLLDHARNEVIALLVGARRDPRVLAIDRVRNLRTGSPGTTDLEAGLQGLPGYRPDDEALLLAEHALRGADPTGGNTYGAVRLEIRDGTAYLGGNVRFPIQKSEAEEAVRRARSVTEVRNDIATDWDIQIAVAEAIAEAGLTRRGTVLVKSSLGRVTLSGVLMSDEDIRQATTAASGITGVRDVASNLGIAEPSAAQTGELPTGVEGEEEPEEETSGQVSAMEQPTTL